MHTKTLQIPTLDGHADAFAAFPDSGEQYPGVLMYPDGFGIRPALREMAEELAGHDTAERALRDADAYLEFLTTRPEVSAGPVAVTGYCIGGLLAVHTAVAHPGRVAALAAFHAPVGADGLDKLSELAAEVHFGHAETDLTPQDLRRLDQALAAAGVEYTSEIYPGTVHGFTMSDTDDFDPSALRRHWDRLLPLLGRALGNGGGSR
ncbi:dienelactone hydrolase family protein [Nocardia ignorata]|uniref:Carboxymethylenebutenolidase n=1 Tax=Nocardia ignorata TaxID=145285 RepID=A0A4R6PIA4_NOCIG|nr:dienelactone hydrolase family protein [Nocardia ignorata]TDP38078.1 carboxymethylenebutenolidase [Nocardia ignorata]